MADYDDDYPTCEETFATLRLFHDQDHPEAVTKLLGIEPTKSQRAGDRRPKSRTIIRASGWFLRSDGYVTSRDVRRHIDWILDKLGPLDAQFQAVRDSGWSADVVCYWVGIGQGGPMLDPHQMERLASLGLRCGFDIHFGGEKQEAQVQE